MEELEYTGLSEKIEELNGLLEKYSVDAELIKKIDDKVKWEIQRKTAYALPNRPSEAGMSPEQIKAAFYRAMTDAEKSVFAEINRIISEVDRELLAMSDMVREIKTVFEIADTNMAALNQRIAKESERNKKHTDDKCGSLEKRTEKLEEQVKVYFSGRSYCLAELYDGGLSLSPEDLADDDYLKERLCVNLSNGLVPREAGFFDSIMPRLRIESYVEGIYRELSCVERYTEDLGGMYFVMRYDFSPDNDLVLKMPSWLNDGEWVSANPAEVYILPKVKEAVDKITRVEREQKATTEELERVSRRVEVLEYVSNNALYKDVEADGEAKAVAVPDGVLPYGSVTSVGGVSYVRARNVIPSHLYECKNSTTSGITRTVYPDGSITFTGTATAEYTAWLFRKVANWHVGSERFYLSGCPLGGSDHTWFFRTQVFRDSGDISGLGQWRDYGEGCSVDLSGIEYGVMTLSFVIKAGVTVDITLEPQLELGDKKTKFEPYTLKSTAVRYITVKGRNRAFMESTATAVAELGDNYFVMQNKGGGMYTGRIYLNGLVPGKTYTLFLKTNHAASGAYPYMYVNNSGQVNFDNRSVKRVAFTAKTDGNRDSMSLYFHNSGGGLTAKTYIEVIEGDVAEPSNLFVPIHEDYTYEIPEEVRGLEAYGHGIKSNKRLNYVNFDERKYYQVVYEREYEDGDEDRVAVTDGVRTISGTVEESVLGDVAFTPVITDISGSIPEDGVIIPLVSSDTIIFLDESGAELQMPVKYNVKYQVKV